MLAQHASFMTAFDLTDSIHGRADQLRRLSLRSFTDCNSSARSRPSSGRPTAHASTSQTRACD